MIDTVSIKMDLTPTEGESLGEYLRRCGVENFSAREVLTAKRVGVVSQPPPREWWPRIIPTLFLAERLRMMVSHPLVVGNGYRPPRVNRAAGGAKRSRHLTFRALDLDLPASHATRQHQEDLYRAAGLLYLEHSKELGVGLGLYRPWYGRRVHLDTGRMFPAHWSRKYTAPLLGSLK